MYQIAEDSSFSKLLENRGIPYIVVSQIIHEFGFKPDGNRSLLIKDKFLNAKAVLFVSRRNMETAKRQLTSDITNGVIITNPANISDTNILSFPKILEDKVHFALLGNLLVNHKGQDLILEVLSQDKWKSRKWQLDIYGVGSDEQYLKNLCVLYKLEDKVNFKGFTNDIKAVWETHHILLMPSLMEGMPLAVIEAMLCGRPVLATDVGGHRELIIHGKNGFIANSPGTHAIDIAMDEAWQRRHEWRELGLNAHITAKEYYDPNVGSNLLDFIEKQLNTTKNVD